MTAKTRIALFLSLLGLTLGIVTAYGIEDSRGGVKDDAPGDPAASVTAPAAAPEPPKTAQPAAPPPISTPIVPPPPPRTAPTLAPIITIKAPRSVDSPHLVRVEITQSGGPVRELEITITPEPDEDDLLYGFKEITGPDGRTVRIEDRNKIAFTGPPAVYTIEVLAIGADKGYAKQEARVQIRDPRPPITAGPTAASGGARQVASAQPEDMLRQWVAGVNSSNRQTEAVEIAKAARETAQEIRDRRAEPDRAVEAWKTAAYLRMGKSFAAWNRNPNGKSFFEYVEELFVDSAGLKDFNPANLLDSLASILEGN